MPYRKVSIGLYYFPLFCQQSDNRDERTPRGRETIFPTDHIN